MKKRSILFIIMALATAAGLYAQADTLVVMTYNLRQGERASMERLAAEITASGADFVALQEVDVNTWREIAKGNSGVNFINELAARTGLFGYFARTVDYGGGYYGIGLLSRYPFEKVEKTPLPNPDNTEPRVVLSGIFEVGGRRMVMASTHLDWEHESTIAEQACAAMAYIQSLGLPAIIAGDFNVEPGSEAVNRTDAGMKLLKGHWKTYPAWEPDMEIDYIYGYPKAAFTLLDSHSPSPSPTAASDHLPVISRILWH